jgi:archaellum component FlaC
MSEFNIVELIEDHPISKLTSTYNVKLLDKIKENFSDADQQLFIGSFYCYLNYDTKRDYVVDLDDVWKWIGFSQKVRAHEVLERHFTVDSDYQQITSQMGARVEEQKGRGGHNIKKIMMTIKCFKSLCLKAQTKKASEIHDYYLKLEEILHETLEENGKEITEKMEEHKRQLDQTIEDQKRLLDQKDEALTKSHELERHKILLRKYGQITGSLVYIVRIKEGDNGTYIIKIGESRKGIKNRLTEFKHKYGNQVLILDCFPVHDSAGLEKYLHHHPEIHPHQVKNLEGHETEQELFLMGGDLTYQRLLDIIDICQSQFHYLPSDYELLKLENEQLRSQTTTSAATMTSPMDHAILQQILQKVQTLEATNKDIITRLNAMQTKTTTVFSQPDPHLGPRLQKIHPETLQILHVYETVTECMKENLAMKRPSINKAVREHTIYRGFRWQLIDRELDPHTAQTLAPTKATKPQKNGYVAKVNQEQTEILHVYLDRKTAAQENNYPSIASLDNAVKNHTIKDGHYYQLYEECDALKERFQEKHGTIVLYHDGIGQYDSQHTLIAEFTSRFECTARAGISQKSLAKVLDQPLLYKEWYFKSLGEKRYV